MATITGFPTQLYAGDSVSFTVTDADYLPAIWFGRFSINGVFNNVTITSEQSEDGLSHVFTLDPVTSAELKRENCQFHLFFESGTARKTVRSGTIRILPDPSQPLDFGWITATITNLETAIKTLSTGTNQSVNINGQTFQKRSLQEYIKARRELLAELEVMKSESGLPAKGGRKSIFTKFV